MTYIFECQYNNVNSSEPNTASFEIMAPREFINVIESWGPNAVAGWLSRVTRGEVALPTSPATTARRVRITVEME